MKTTLCIIAITLALCFSARADAGQRTQDLARHHHSHYHYYSGRHFWHNRWYGSGYYGPSVFVGSPYYYYGGPGFSVVASGPVGYPYPVGGYWSSGRYYYHGHRWHR